MSPLAQLRNISPDVVAAAVLSPEGEILAVDTDADLEDVIGPILTTFSTMAERTVQELGRGGLKQVVLEGTQGLVVVHDLGGGQTLTAIANPHARLGLLLDDVRACAASLESQPLEAANV